MKFLPLVWKNLWRRKIRTIFTLACIVIAFVLFGLLMTIRAAFSFGVDIAGVDRLIVIHKVSLIQPLPISYKTRIGSVGPSSWMVLGSSILKKSRFSHGSAFVSTFSRVSETRETFVEPSGAT